APENAKRLNRARGLGATHVGGLPAELFEDAGHGFLGIVVISADEHGRRAVFKSWIHHVVAADRIEGFDETRIGKLTLKLLHERLIGPDEELHDAIDDFRIVRDRITRINDDLAGEVISSGRTKDFRGG